MGSIGYTSIDYLFIIVGKINNLTELILHFQIISSTHPHPSSLSPVWLLNIAIDTRAIMYIIPVIKFLDSLGS